MKNFGFAAMAAILIVTVGGVSLCGGAEPADDVKQTLKGPLYRLMDPQVLGDEEPADQVNVRRVIPAPDQLFVIDTDGALYAMGINRYGNLGLPDHKAYPELTQVVPGGVRHVAASGKHTLIVKRDGSLWAVGRNHGGQLGLGDTKPRRVPEKVVDGGVVTAATGRGMSMFLKEDGSLWAMGQNTDGALGVGNPYGSARGVKGYFVKGRDEDTPKRVESSGVLDIAVYGNCGYFLKKDGSLWATGLEPVFRPDNDRRFRPDEPGAKPRKLSDGPIRMAVGGGYEGSFVFFIKSDGSLWSVGSNRYGLLQTGDDQDRAEPFRIEEDGVVDVSCSTTNMIYLTADGRVHGTMPRLNANGTETSRTFKTEGLKNVRDIWVERHVLMLDRNGALWGIGDNSSLALGTPEGLKDTKGGVRGGRYRLETTRPVRISAEQRVRQVMGHSSGTIWVNEQNELWTLGWFPSRGMEDEQYVAGGSERQFPKDRLPHFTRPTQLHLPEQDTRAVMTRPVTDFTEDGLEEKWITVNDNVMGGRSTGGPTFKDKQLVFSGKTNTDGGGFSSIRSRAKPMGFGGHSGLVMRVKGDGRTYKADLHAGIRMAGMNVAYRADFATAEGKWQEVWLPFDRFHPTLMGRPVGDRVPALKTEDIETIGFMIYDKKDGPFRLEVDSVKVYATVEFAMGPGVLNASEDTRPPADYEITPGIYNLFVHTGNGKLYGMGVNRKGRLGLGETPATRELKLLADKSVRTVASYSHTLLVTENGALLAMGENNKGQLGLGDLDNRLEPVIVVESGVTDAAVGRWCSMFLKEDGTLWGMGGNRSGILGVGGTRRIDSPVQIDDKVVSLAMSNNMALYRKKDGSLWASGLEPILQPDDPRNVPRRIYSGDFVKAVCASSTVFLLKPDGSLWSMGADYQGVLGRDTDGPSAEWGVVCEEGVVDVVASRMSNSAVYLKDDRTLLGIGGLAGDKPEPAKLPVNDVQDVWVGQGEYLLVLERDGTVRGMGGNGSLVLNAKNRRQTYDTPVRIFNDLAASAINGLPFAAFAIGENGALWTVGWSPDPKMGGEPFHLPDEDQRLASPQPRRISMPEFP